MPRKTSPPTSLEEYRRKRDFTRTPEPAGGATRPAPATLRFVVQKHAASHLHYDLRLEMDGVMRSWAVPKGPSLDPAVKRLAMEVEDHPIEYNEFEGTIPAGEYGGGTVMLWDTGEYAPDEARRGESPNAAANRGYREGKLSFTLHGERLSGSFALVRTEAAEGGPRSKWLFFKHKDDAASPGSDVTEEVTTSVVSGRTMDEIARGKGGKRVWRSNRSRPPLEAPAAADASALRPMLASAGTEPRGDGWIFEPKFDGIRVLAFAAEEAVALITRNGHDKAIQFPEIVEAMKEFVEDLGEPVVLDGEIVALDAAGRIARFESLQGRMHTRDRRRIAVEAKGEPSAFVAFDLLLSGSDIHLNEPLRDRRRVLEDLFEDRLTERLRISPTSPDRRALLRKAEREGWEGILAKRLDSLYRPGQRSPNWVKIKIENRQELVVGGWTEPRGSRSLLGAILLGYYDEEGSFRYAGHTGTGFDERTLAEMHRRLEPLERKTPPFSERPQTNQPAHWVTPKVVVEVRFNEWTREGKLRQPVFIGIRDDKDPREVRREPAMGERGANSGSTVDQEQGGGEPGRVKGAPKGRVSAARTSGAAAKAPNSAAKASGAGTSLDNAVVEQLRTLAKKGGGELRVGRGGSIPITSLAKVFYPETGHTKEDLLVYYARMGDLILPWMKDRALVLKRYPNGVDGESFYQQAAPDSVPPGVRVETLEIEEKEQRRLVGGNLATLLYTVQLGAISFDPWHSRITALKSADYTILDLDPGPGTKFGHVVDVALWIQEEMEALGLHGGLKTSGSEGLHIYLPLPPRTPLDAATLVAQIIATRVAHAHPKHATIERMTRKRPKGTVYVDYLQNILGKTVAGVYAARARPRPTVSTPLSWDELTHDLDPHDFTIDTVPARIAAIGDQWAPVMERPNSLDRLTPG